VRALPSAFIVTTNGRRPDRQARQRFCVWFW